MQDTHFSTSTHPYRQPREAPPEIEFGVPLRWAIGAMSGLGMTVVGGLSLMVTCAWPEIIGGSRVNLGMMELGLIAVGVLTSIVSIQMSTLERPEHRQRGYKW